MVKETARTLLYVCITVVSVGIAFATHFTSRPKPLKEFEKVGTPFFSDDFDPNSAKSLKVVSFNEEAAKINTFMVEAVDGKWVIPSHFSYPADAQDRLSKTTASVIGVTRDALASRLASDHHLYNVLDPSKEDTSELEKHGSRLTITRADGTVLTDLIIGKEVEGRSNHYYVRVPDEKETYISKLDIDLSVKFSDWIEQDLLKIDRGDLRDILINKYSIDEVQGRIVGQEINHLAKATPSDDWKLDELKEATEEINKSDISTLVGNLDDLKIVGVRPKPQGLNPDLSLDPQIKQNPILRQALLGGLASAGFFLAKDQNGNPVLVSNEGELTAGTKEGVVYNIRFGQIFTGGIEEVETGLSKDSKKEKEAEKTKDDKTEKPSEKPEEDKADKKDDKQKKNRYLFVSVTFDPKLLGPAPVKPVEPKKPAEEKKKKPVKKDEPKKNDKTDKDKSKKDKPEKEVKKEEKKENVKKEEEKEDPLKKYEEDKIQYELDLTKYEADLKKHEESIKAGQKKVNDLNRRFANWYYVISAESFEELRLSRADLVKPKEEKKADDKPIDLLKSPKAPAEKPASEKKTKKKVETPPPSELEKKEKPKPTQKEVKKEPAPEKRETKKIPLKEIKTEEPPPQPEKVPSIKK
jgi:hypothetical protein